MLLLIQITLLLNFSLAKENSITQLENGQAKLRTEIQNMINKSTCAKETDCQVLMLGNKGGCGNPDTFWAYNPKSVKKNVVSKLVLMERKVAAKIKKEKNKGKEIMMGACGFSIPKALCSKNKCSIDSSKEKYKRM